MSVEYFHDSDASIVYACLGISAIDAIFSLHLSEGPDARWEFVYPGDPTHDAIHQKIYRNHRADKIRLEDFPTKLPPLPEIPPGPYPRPEKYFLPEQPIESSKHPLLSNHLAARKDKSAILYIVLYEDTYESFFGDGVFYYFKAAFLSKAEAQAYITGNKRDFVHYHLRETPVQLEGSVIRFPDFKLQLFDNYDPSASLSEIEARLAL